MRLSELSSIFEPSLNLYFEEVVWLGAVVGAFRVPDAAVAEKLPAAEEGTDQPGKRRRICQWDSAAIIPCIEINFSRRVKRRDWLQEGKGETGREDRLSQKAS